MAIAATVFIGLGVLIAGFGLLSLSNVLNLPITRTQAEHSDLTDPRFRMTMVRIMLVGVALILIGALCAVAASA